MADKLVPMDRAYREKHYPKGYFAAIAKGARGGGIALIICGAVLALMGGGILALVISSMTDGDFNPERDLSAMIFFGVVGLLFLVPGILIIWGGIRRRRMKAEDWIRKFAEVSDYPESVIRDFGNQALEDGSVRMQLGANAIQGVLTRDYICICNLLAPCIIKIEDIVGTYFVEMSNQISVNGRMKTIYNTNIVIFSNHKTQMVSQAKEKTVRQLIEILTIRNPAIETAGGRLLSEKEYQIMEAKYCK